MKHKKIGFKKLMIGFAVIISVTLFSAISGSLVIRNNSKTILHINNDVYPFMDKLNKFEQIVLKSKMLITNWVYLQYNIDDKEELKRLHQTGYPQIKHELLSVLEAAGHEDNQSTLNTIFAKMDSLLQVEKRLMKTLVSFEDYENAEIIFGAEEVIEEQVIPQSAAIQDLLESFVRHANKENDALRNSMLLSLNRLELTMVILGFGMFLIILFSIIYIQKTITTPVLQMHDILLKLSKGELVKGNIKRTDNVIVHMADALTQLSDNFYKTAITAQKIGRGNFNTPVQPLGENDILGNSIQEMGKSLKEYAEQMEEKVRIRTIEISRQKEIIEERNKNITASITYAERIQKAGLPAIQTMPAALKNSFILFKPRDIVSGDFYWFAPKNDKIVITAVDCTGHGVPGAFMSLIGMNLLSAIVNENGITEANIILDELHKRVQQALRQDVTENDDGMDVSLCVIDLTKKTLEFSGAKNPLIYIKNNELHQIKGDKKGVGGKQRINEKFTKHSVKIDSPISFYIFSDGYQDQFGGKANRKFMIKNMKEMFLKNHHLPMPQQQEIYDKNIADWMQNTGQVDDMLLIGFEL